MIAHLHLRRVVLLKAVVTVSFFAYHFSPDWGLSVSLLGNLLWLWGPLNEVHP